MKIEGPGERIPQSGTLGFVFFNTQTGKKEHATIYNVDRNILKAALDKGDISTSQYERYIDEYIKHLELVNEGLAAGGMKLGGDVVRLERDAVTGLLKHEALENRLTHLMKELNEPPLLERRHGGKFQAILVLFLDLDNLRIWNGYGQQKGDEAMRAMVDSVNGAIHDSGVMFRRGDKSDEVIPVLKIESDRKITDKDIINNIIPRIKEAACKGKVEINGKKMAVTAAVGYSIIRSGDPRSIKQILDESNQMEIEEKKDPTIKEKRIKEAQAKLDQAA